MLWADLADADTPGAPGAPSPAVRVQRVRVAVAPSTIAAIEDPPGAVPLAAMNVTSKSSLPDADDPIESGIAPAAGASSVRFANA